MDMSRNNPGFFPEISWTYRGNIPELLWINRKPFLKCTPGQMNSLFSYFFTEWERVILGGVRDYFGEVSGGKIEEHYPDKNQKKIWRTLLDTTTYYLTQHYNSPFSYRGVSGTCPEEEGQSARAPTPLHHQTFGVLLRHSIGNFQTIAVSSSPCTRQ